MGYQATIIFATYWFSSSKSLLHAQEKQNDFEIFMLFINSVLLDIVEVLPFKNSFLSMCK